MGISELLDKRAKDKMILLSQIDPFILLSKVTQKSVGKLVLDGKPS